MGQTELVLMVWVALATIVAAADVPGGYYQSKFEALDVDDVLNHKRLVHHYAACMLNRGPCPPQGADLKRILPEAIETSCLRCTEKQRIIILKSIRRMRAEYPTLFRELVDYYDPTEENIRKVEIAITNVLGEDNEPNFIGNRFGDSDSGNDLAAPVNPLSDDSPYPSPVSTTARPSSTPRPSSSARPSSSFRPTATSSSTTPRPYPSARPSSSFTPTATSSSTTATPSSSITVITSGLTTKPISFSPSTNDAPIDTTSTNRPSFLTRWRLTTVPTDWTRPPTYGWRPNSQTLQPFNIPLLKVDAGIRLLGSVADLGTRVLQAGTEVAGMVLSTVQQVLGGQPVN